MGAMPHYGDHGYQHGENADGEADGAQARVAGGVFVLLLEFVGFAGVHGK
jgi:hypothetical protein